MPPVSSCWTANEYYRNVKSIESTCSLELIDRKLLEQDAYRNPSIVALCPEMYRLPLTSLAWIYSSNPSHHRERLLSATGAPHSHGIWARFATLAGLALRHRDFVLLGRIALECELASQIVRVTSGDPEGRNLHEFAERTKGPESSEHHAKDHSNTTDSSLLNAFLTAFDLQQRRISLPDYIDAAVGYLSGLPASFIVPFDLIFPDAVKSGSAAKNNWRLLRHFWTSHLEFFPNFPEKLALIAVAPNAQVVEWVGRMAQLPTVDPREIEIHAETQSGADAESESGIESPFAELAVEVPDYIAFTARRTATGMQRRSSGFLRSLWDRWFNLFR